MSLPGLSLACYQLLSVPDCLAQQLVSFCVMSLPGLLTVANVCLIAWPYTASEFLHEVSLDLLLACYQMLTYARWPALQEVSFSMTSPPACCCLVIGC
jgi:hypothetical protein